MPMLFTGRATFPLPTLSCDIKRIIATEFPPAFMACLFSVQNTLFITSTFSHSCNQILVMCCPRNVLRRNLTLLHRMNFTDEPQSRWLLGLK